MPANKPTYLLFLFTACKSIAAFFAGIQYIFIKIGFLKTPFTIAKLTQPPFKTLHDLWYLKLARRLISFLVRTPARRTILKLVHFNIPIPTDKGCIIVICHTPWKRLLVQWCLENKFALLIGGGKWTDRRRTIQRKGAGIRELRELVKYLQSGGRIVIKAVAFNQLNDCPVRFLGNQHNASRFAERLAIITKVPIVTVLPMFADNTIEFMAGPRFSTEGLKSRSNILTTWIISFFEKEIESNPILLANYVI